MKRFFAYPAVRVGLAIALLLTLVLSIPATRSLAGQFLALFRVKEVAVLPVDFTGLQQLAGDSSLGVQIHDLLSKSLDVTKKPSEPVTVASAAEASDQAGFSVRLPQGTSPSGITVQGGMAFSFKVDLARAQALLNEAGRSDLVLPKSIDGAQVSVDVPASVVAAYNTCPTLSAEQGQPGLNMGGTGSAGRRYSGCVYLAQIPSPQVDAPAGVDVGQLAQIALQFTGMSASQAAAYSQTIDWTSTLVVPIPKNAATYKQVQVDGVTGMLIQRPSDDAPDYVLLWVKNGIIYVISGLGSNSQLALQMANSLR